MGSLLQQLTEYSTYTLNPDDRITSMTPTESSVYTQQYDWNDKVGRAPVPSSYYGDVSPPESPSQSNRRNSGDVSPIENDIERDIHPAFRIRQQKSSTSNIPVPRKAVSSNTSSPRAYQRDPSRPTRWDKDTGEPTVSDRGLPHRVKPGTVVEGIESIKLRKTSTHGSEDESNLPPIDKRPPWKGASGRAAIVEPVADHPGQKLPVPRREVRKPSPINISQIPTSISPDHVLHSPQSTVADIEGSVTPTATTRPNPTLLHKSGMNANSLETSQNLTQSDSDDTLKRPRGPRPHNQPKGDMMTSSRGETSHKSGSDVDSRFSWTTQATNTTYHESPPPSPPPPMPALPANFSNTTSTSSYPSDSIMNRSRPVPSSKTYSNESDPDETSKPPPSYKPISAFKSNRAEGSIGARKASYTPSIATTTTGGPKALPPTPQELSSQDHVSALQAQLQDLTTQKNNVQRVLRDLSAPGASNPLVTNFKVEREREKRIQALRDELNEISLQEHDIGLKLHRAQRRREQEEGYEGFTTLWVRRVTS
jgi:hypothetical protein